jgi:hypothetical protein
LCREDFSFAIPFKIDSPVLLYTAMPEPGSAITASLAILTLLVLRRSR